MWYNKYSEREVRPMKNGIECWAVLTIVDSEPVVIKYYKDHDKAHQHLFCAKYTTKERYFWIEKRNLPKWLDKVIEM